jgi:multiple sugar transport system substrate-binding protein
VRLPRTAMLAALTAATVAASTMLAACGGSSSADSSPTTLTYWASDQGTSIANDKQVLQPEIAKFEKQTGITVNYEVVPWSDLLNRILAAATSGKGPDVLNIGNTWSASLQATNAFLPFDDSVMNQVGGKAKFLPGSLAATGADGKPPVGVPIYSNAYGLYYNKKMFAAAGIANPPTTWADLVADGKKLTHGSQWGLAVEGGSYTENAHQAFIFGQEHGAQLFDSSGKPQFDSAQEVAGVKQYVDLLATDKIVNPTDAEYANGTEAVQDFASGKAAMLMWQGSDGSLKTDGMNPADYGLAPIPLPTAGTGNQVDSMVAGINISVFKNTKNQAGALKFVNFLTSTNEQEILNKAYGSLPSVKAAYTDPAFQTTTDKTLQQVLSTTSAPLPQVPSESQFETLVGNAMKGLFADAASGKPVTDASVKAALSQANQQMTASG